jgi:SSS family solute:Na+ symporter
MLLVNLFYWGTNQAIIQRALGAKNLVEGQKGLVYGAFLKILGPLILVLPGIIAYHIFEGNLAKADLAYASLVAEVLPKPLVGFFAAVLFGAILSSFNSALNSCVTLFGIDIYQEYVKKDASEKEIVKAGKTFGVFLALLAMIVAPFIANAGSVFEYLQEINGTYSIPILTIVVVGYLTKYVPAKAAKIGLISGVVLYSISQFLIKPTFNLVEIINGKETVIGNSYPHFLHIMAILFVLNIIIMLIIGKISPRKEAYVQYNSKEVDITPWKYLKPVGALICIIVIGIYVYFS